jgi:hypothetical protein
MNTPTSIPRHLDRAPAVLVAVGVALAGVLSACSSTAPGGSASLALPSVDVSAAASAGAQAALAALDSVDAAITANQTSTGLTTDEAASLKSLTAAIRTALQSGDMTAAKTAFEAFSTKFSGMAAKLNTDAGKQLTVAVAALKAALAAG